MAVKPSPFRLRGKTELSYLASVKAFPLATIGSREHLEAAQQVLDRLLAAEKLDAGQQVYVGVLSDLIASYEDKHFPITPASDADMLRHLLDAKGVSQADLSRETGIAKSSLSEVLAGKKRFSRGMIPRLAVYFGVDTSLLAANL